MDQHQMNHLGGAVAGMMGFFALFGLALVLFFIFLYWRILTKAGLPGALSLLSLIPGIGWIIVLCILAFSQWRVVPIAPTPYYPPSYPPPPANYPPAQY